MSDNIQTKLVYCSAGCSRSNNALTAAPDNCSSNAFVAYASSNFVSVVGRTGKDPEAFRIYDTPSLRNAKSEVSSVFWFTDDVILFGGSEGTLCVYSRSKRHLSHRKFHAESVTSVHAIGGFGGVENKFLIVSCSADGLVRISIGISDKDCLCSIDKENFQDIRLDSKGRALPLEVNLCALPCCKAYLLSVGSDDGRLRLYVSPFTSLNFELATILVGHTDWVTSITTRRISDELTYLASSSQDSTVRVWKIYLIKNKESESDGGDDELSNFRADLKKSNINFKCSWMPDVNIYIRLETILKGHTDWVYTVDMCVDAITSSLSILTCSIDRSVIVWREPADGKEDGIWTESARFARIGGTGSAAGMSYCGAKFAENGSVVVAHSYTGALHAWKKSHDETWLSIPMPSGHLGQVTDLAWEPTNGQYFLSVGADQTTRLHSPWSLTSVWYEFGRPQIHGYGFNSIATMSSTSFVSAGDEKAMRAFSMPRLVKNLLSELCDFESDDTGKSGKVLGATVAPLGLTNRGFGEEDSDQSEEDGKDINDDEAEENGGKGHSFDTVKSSNVTKVSVVNTSQPPTPEVLIQQTLWPEMRKLYAHGSEVYAVDVYLKDGRAQLMASACKATSMDTAQIIIWAPWYPPGKPTSVETFDWRPIQHLDGPTLTVTQLRFSNSGNYLLGVSRDRTWHLYRCNEDHAPKMEKCASLQKSSSPHSRIIWTCDWTADDRLFATGSRDMTVLLWQPERVAHTQSATQFSTKIGPLPSSVTAVTFSASTSHYVLAVGLESGSIHLFTVEFGANNEVCCSQLYQLPDHICPSKSISRLRFQPSRANKKQLLAASSAEWGVRLYNLVELLCN